MNNYNSNNNSYVDQPILSESRYIIYNEQNQSQWIDSIAKQAAKLISDQLKCTNKKNK